ncbi:MAG: hypothetical protein WCH39_06580 [Schlesneria sp.]
MSAQLDSPPIPASLQMASDVEQRLRDQQVGIYFVMPRVVRRVLQNELDIASPLQQPPHRKSCVVQRDRLLWLVARDELGVDDRIELPDQIILIAQPEEHQLETMTREELQRYYWRLMFHARIDYEMLARTSRARMSMSELRSRIDQIGQSAFDEIRSVLRSEQMLTRPDDDRNVYAEFVAVYHELQAFCPHLISLYFPSLPASEIVLNTIGPECDAKIILEETRPIDLPHDVASNLEVRNLIANNGRKGSKTAVAPNRSARHYASLVRQAEKLSDQKNHVRAALVRQVALDVVPEESIDSAKQLLREEIQKLVSRLQSALEMTDAIAHSWLEMCEKLLPSALQGFWNPNARLLYDLQTVCFDHEQEIYKVDLLGWLISRGKSPLKRPLPKHRVVLMSKHLRRAALRAPNVEIDAEGRIELSRLLHDAADSAEHILRVRLVPTIDRALIEAGFVPSSIVERVALKKMVHELSDGVVERGFITLGGLRDVISRNQFKMPDLNDATEFFTGDPLLRADKLMSVSLDGVYQRGPFYLRWLQKLNSLAYGIPWGRLLTLYVALPFGLSFLLLMSIEEIGHLLLRHSSDAHLTTSASVTSTLPVEEASAATEVPSSEKLIEHSAVPSQVAHAYRVYSTNRMLLLGCVIFALIHFPLFRQWFIWFLKTTWYLLKILLIDIPRAILRWHWVDRLLKSFPMMLFRRFILAPLLATMIFWKLLPFLGVYGSLNIWWGIVIFVASYLTLNSRVGRDTEELAREFFSRTWYRIRVHLVMGLFTLVIDVFRAFMDGLERVLYAVDEWLRFRSGESNLTLGVKAIIGLVWAFVHGVIRFCVTLLIEPQLNPIKHFPVVTVSHKILFATFYLPLSYHLEKLFHLRSTEALFGATLILMCIPGVFGFLAWELKENWRLYRANRSLSLRPVQIGEHGETLLRLLCPGFHSGTIPRLFAKQRRAANRDVTALATKKQARFAERLHHESKAVQHFIERELVALLDESRAFRDYRLIVSEVELATNRIAATIEEPSKPNQPMKLEFAEQSGWLIAVIREPGWLTQVEATDAEVFKVALTGLFKLASVDLVREQIERQLAITRSSTANDREIAHGFHPYDIGPRGLIVWPNCEYEHEVIYPLDDQPVTHPRPRSFARAAGLNPLPMDSLVFGLYELEWDEWRQFWDNEQRQTPHSEVKFSFKM